MLQSSGLYKSVVISKIIRQTPSAVTLVLDPVGWTPVWRSGQFLTLVFQTRHGEKRRSYSISSSAELAEPLEVTVKRVANGEFSRQLCDDAREGDLLITTGVGGFFTLPDPVPPGQDFCFMAAGSGIGPIFPIIKTLLVTTEAEVTLYYSNRNAQETIFYEALNSLAATYSDRFHLRYFLSTNKDLREGRLSKSLFDAVLTTDFGNEIHGALFYLCGPFEYMQTLEIVLRTYTSPLNLRFEKFHTWLPAARVVPPDIQAHRVTVKLLNNTYHLTSGYPESVNKAAKRAGVALPYSCEAGRCGSCIARATKGVFWMAYNEVLTDREVANGSVLVCQAYPQWGDGELTFE